MDRHTNGAFERLEIVETGRRRRWSKAAKEQIVLESFSAPRLISSTARRHNISRSLLLIWRRAFVARSGQATEGFVPAVIVPEVDRAASSTPGAPLPASPSRLEIVLRCGRRIVVEGAVDSETVLKLARGLEAIR